MEGLFLQILNMSVSANWLILAVILIRLLMGKAPKGLRYVLWALVGIRLLCPVFIESDFSLIPSAETFVEESVNSDKPEIHSGVAFLDEIINPVLPTTPNVPSVENVVGNDAAQDDLLQHGSAQNNATQDDVTSEESISPMIMLSWAWLIGILGMLGYALISYMRLRETVKPSMQLEDNLWICDEIQSSFIMGLVNPRIYMPSYVGEEHKPYIVAHEMEHLRYRDHWWKPLGFAILAIHWFNPLVWVAYILMCRDIELACDERVIQAMGVEEKKNYSKSLLLCSNPRHFISACPVAFGEVGVKERIKRIVDYKKPAVWAAGLGIVVCVVIAICFMTNPKEDTLTDETKDTEVTESTDDVIDEEDTENHSVEMVYVDVGVSDDELTLMQKVLFNKAPYSLDRWIGEIDGIYWSATVDNYWEYAQFFCVDLDHDGVDEVCVEYPSGLILILHEEDDVIYGYPFEYRPFHPVYKDGTFSGSSSAVHGNFSGNVSFEKDAFSFEIITSTEYETDGSVHYYKAGHQYGGEGAGIEITKEEYDEIMSNYAMEEVERYAFTIDNILKYVK